jgi:serine/threonine protein kinase
LILSFLLQPTPSSTDPLCVCCDSRSGRKVALKVIKVANSLQGGNGISLDLVREVKFLTTFTSIAPQHVVNLMDAFFNKTGDIVMVFEYMQADLSGVLSPNGTMLKDSHVRGILRQVLEGLAILHEHGVMHRDCKASNLLINDEGFVKLADFGLATNYKQREVFGCNVVTLWYRAPELLLGDERYGPAVDMWAAGCILYELMARRSLFPGAAERQQLQLIIKVLGTPNDSSWPGVASLPNYRATIGEMPYMPPSLRETLIPELGSDANTLDLAARLFSLAPDSRITAAEALRHPYFRDPGFPVADRHELPRCAPLHDYEVRKRRRLERAAASRKADGASSKEPKEGRTSTEVPKEADGKKR